MNSGCTSDIVLLLNLNCESDIENVIGEVHNVDNDNVCEQPSQFLDCEVLFKERKYVAMATGTILRLFSIASI